jgi:hypothetical protein
MMTLYLEAIRFYGRAAERFARAVELPSRKFAVIRNDSGKLKLVSEVAVFRSSRTRFFIRGMSKACSF